MILIFHSVLIRTCFTFRCDRQSGIWVADNLDSSETSLYVKPNDTKSEIWEGRILGPDFVSKNMPVNNGYSINSFEQDLNEYIQHENFTTIYSD